MATSKDCKKNFLMKMISDKDDVSSKRVVAIVAFLLMCVAFILNMFLDLKMKEFIWDGMLWLTLGGLGLTVVEKFSNKKAGAVPPPPPPPEDPKKEEPIDA
jgi:hypothetical protein